MDRGNIPGFWYDKEKKKYFKIQADHLLPSDAQYSQGKVKRQLRKAKRQKFVHRERRARDQQTVLRSKLWNHPCLGGIGLRRELGSITTRFALQLSDATFVSQWSVTRVYVLSQKELKCSPPFNLLDAEYLPDTGQLVTTDRYGDTRPNAAPNSDVNESIYRVSLWNSDWLRKYSSRVQNDLEKINRGEYYYPPGKSGTWYGCHTPGTIICGGEEAGVCNMTSRNLMGLVTSDVTFMLKQSALLDVSLHESTHYLAVREYAHVKIFDQDLCVKTRIDVGDGSTLEGNYDGKQFCPTIDWLDANTVVYGDNGTFKRPAVLLWDIRYDKGQVVRFTVGHRITGILAADNSGCRIFVSTNYHIYLFDTRRGGENEDEHALLKFPHVHEGPQCQMATNKLGLLAAVDCDSVIQLYSIWTGNRIGSLKMPRRPTPSPALFECRRIMRLKWYDGGCEGPGLTACQGGSVLRWSWQ